MYVAICSSVENRRDLIVTDFRAPDFHSSNTSVRLTPPNFAAVERQSFNQLLAA